MSDPLSYRPTDIPTDPGVYRFYDDKDNVIYVGKAKNLKNRLIHIFKRIYKLRLIEWYIQPLGLIGL